MCMPTNTFTYVHLCVPHSSTYNMYVYIYLRVGWKQGAQVFNYPEMVVDTVSPPHVSPSFV